MQLRHFLFCVVAISATSAWSGGIASAHADNELELELAATWTDDHDVYEVAIVGVLHLDDVKSTVEVIAVTDGHGSIDDPSSGGNPCKIDGQADGGEGGWSWIVTNCAMLTPGGDDPYSDRVITMEIRIGAIIYVLTTELEGKCPYTCPVDAPTDLVLTPKKGGRLHVDWVPANGWETGYNVWIDQIDPAPLPGPRLPIGDCVDLVRNPGFPNPGDPSPPGPVPTECTIDGLSAGVTYEVRVAHEVYRVGGLPVSATTTMPAALPKNPSKVRIVEVTQSSALISWRHNPESNAAFYRVWLSDSEPGGPFCETAAPFTADRPSCRLEGLTPGTVYTANVFAQNAEGGISKRTVRVTFTTLRPPAPNPPEGDAEPPPDPKPKDQDPEVDPPSAPEVDACADDGTHTVKHEKAIRKAERKFAKGVAKWTKKLEERPKKLVKKLRRLTKVRDRRLTKADARFELRCGG